MGRRLHRQCLDECDAQRKARLGIVRQRLLGRAVDQRVEICQPPQRLGRNGMCKGAVVRPVEIARGDVERGFQRQALAQHRVEQPQRGPAGGEAGNGVVMCHLAVPGGRST
jgi:hypothetical protein